MAFREVKSGNMYKFEKAGQVLEGVLKSIEQIEIHGEEATRVNIENKDGLFAPLASADLRRKLEGVTANSLVRITYEGKIKTKKGAMMNSFKVEVDDGT